MASVTYFVVLGFEMTDRGKFVPRDPLTPQSADAARRWTIRMARQGVAGAVAFSRTGDPDLGDWEDAVILAKFGHLPPDIGLLAEPIEPWSDIDIAV